MLVCNAENNAIKKNEGVVQMLLCSICQLHA